MSRFLIFGFLALAPAALAGCAPDYSPNTYAANAVQQANKVERGVVIGYRQVQITANGTVGAVTGGAAGGILGAQADATGLTTALGTVSGTLVGGIVGTTIEHVAGDTTGWEYIIRKPNGDLLSVTQREPQPLPIGQKVLVITGNQARVIADYSVTVDPPLAATADKDTAKEAKEPKEPAPSASSASAAPNALAADPAVAAPAVVAPAISPATSLAASPDGPPAPSAKAKDAAPATPVTPVSAAASNDPAPATSSP